MWRLGEELKAIRKSALENPELWTLDAHYFINKRSGFHIWIANGVSWYNLKGIDWNLREKLYFKKTLKLWVKKTLELSIKEKS